MALAGNALNAVLHRYVPGGKYNTFLVAVNAAMPLLIAVVELATPVGSAPSSLTTFIQPKSENVIPPPPPPTNVQVVPLGLADVF